MKQWWLGGGRDGRPQCHHGAAVMSVGLGT